VDKEIFDSFEPKAASLKKEIIRIAKGEVEIVEASQRRQFSSKLLFNRA